MNARGAFRLIYRRENWDRATASRYRPFETREDAVRFLVRLRRHGEPVQVRLEERNAVGRWVEGAIVAEVEK